jgi:hypothetical protein
MNTHVSLLAVFNEMVALREENWLLREQIQKVLPSRGELERSGFEASTVQLDPYEGGMPSLVNGGHQAAYDQLARLLIGSLGNGGHITLSRGPEEYKLNATVYVRAR